MEKEQELGYSMYYVNKAKEDHIIYPDNYNEEDEGLRPHYFYLHGKAEQLANFDCFNCSPELFSKFLSNGLELAYMEIEGETYELLVFCQFVEGYNQMKGYAVLIDDKFAVMQAMVEYPNAYKPCGGHTVDAYLKENHAVVFELITQNYWKNYYSK